MACFLEKTEKAIILSTIFLFSLVFLAQSQTPGQFYREYWAEFDSTITEINSNHWRVNDESVSLHERYGHRKEPKSNGLLIIPMNEDLFELTGTELYVEMWGGHKRTANKRFYLNGRGPYLLPRTGIEDGYFSYSFPSIHLEIQHLVRGKNAFQFAIDKGKSGWGHYIIREAALRCYLKDEHPDLIAAEMKNFSASVEVHSKNGFIEDITLLSLNYEEKFQTQIDSVVYFARYTGFDDKGLQKDNYWHGITVGRKAVNHVGASSQPLYKVNWNTEMIPDQSSPMAVRAVVYFKNKICYQTTSTINLFFPKERSVVRLYKCDPFPPFFGSRKSDKKSAILLLPNNIDNIEKVQLVVKNWGKHKGHNKDPFRLNDYPYDLFSDITSRIFSFSRIDVDVDHLLPGKNTFTVFSDTEHHSLEIFLPGPVLLIKEKRNK